MFTRTPVWLGAMGLVALFGVLSPQSAAAKPEGERKTAACADCHDDKVAAFASNPHARAAKARGEAPDAVCATCHGDGMKHADSGGTEKPNLPQGMAGVETCLTCHKETNDHDSYRSGVHTATEVVNCFSCHSVHASDPKLARLLKKGPTALCASCHPAAKASFDNKPYGHRIGRGGADCISCHEPHGRPGSNLLKLSRTGELPCLSCHQEKKGPFVFDHVSLAGGCLSCHEAHGSSNPKRLVRAQVDQLCLECHSTLTAGTLGSNPPSFHNVRLPRYQNCTTCHVAIHGSNRSPKLLK